MSSFGNTRFITRTTTLLLAALGACSSDREIVLPVAAPPQPSATAPASAAASRIHPEGYSSRGESGDGYILDRFGKAMAVTYEVHDGKAIWQGDIVLGRPSEVSKTALGARAITRGEAVIARAPDGSQRTLIKTALNFRWPGGIVPYEIESGLPDQARMTDAMAIIAQATGGVTFVPRSGQADFIRFIQATGCSSAIGHQGGEQDINFADDCSKGNAVHETLHALGMYHEQSRCDRDDYVEILLANVISGKEFNFDKECSGTTGLGAYDFGSIMHYGLDFFSSNGMNTMALRPGVTYAGTIGQRDSLSVADVFSVNWMYGSNNIPPVAVIGPLAASYDEGSPVALDATGSTDADDAVLTYRWNFGDGTCFAFPQPADCTQAKPNHVYTQDGVYKIGLFVYDNYIEEATEVFVTIKNVAPVISFFGSFPTIDEGSAILQGGGWTDPGADFWTGTVNYGDGGGVQTLALLSNSFALSHTYADNGSYTVSVGVKDDDVTSTKSATQVVANVVPIVDAGADQTFTSGQTFSFAGSFTDPGLMDSPWAWSIDWGVGTPTTGSTTTQSLITASNRVCGAGTYNVTLSVTDKDGGVGSDAAQVTVGYLAVNLAIMPGSLPLAPISLRKQGSLPVAIISTATFDARTIDVSSLRLGNELGTDTPAAPKKGGYNTSISDVDGDGRLDLIVMFDVPTLVSNGDVTMSTTSLVLRGKLGASGDPCINFRGVGAVKVNS